MATTNTNTTSTTPQTAAPTQPSQAQLSVGTGATQFTDSSSTLQSQVNNTQVTPVNACPDSSTSLQTDPSPTTGWQTSGDGFGITEYKPPKPTLKSGTNSTPAVGSPSTPPSYKNIRCGNQLNKEIKFKCSLVAGIKLDSCLFTFQKLIQNQLDMAYKLAWSWIQQMFPGNLDYITKIAKLVCAIANEIQMLLCLIQQVMQCILSTIQFVTQLVTWVLTLPMVFLSQIISCIASFMGLITGGLKNMILALASQVTSGVTGCNPFQCAPVSSVYDIGNTASATYDQAFAVGSAAGNLTS